MQTQPDYYEIFPTYPVIFEPPKDIKIDLDRKEPYVDLPFPIYIFIQDIMLKSRIINLTPETIKKEWENFLKSEDRKFIIYKNEPLATIHPIKTPPDRILLKLEVNWKLFLEYLEEKATFFIGKLNEGGDKIRELYKDIIANFQNTCRYVLSIGPPEETEEAQTYQKFLILLQHTKDLQKIEDLIQELNSLILDIEGTLIHERGIYENAIGLYTSNILMDIHHLSKTVQTLLIPSAYMLLRNILEYFTKFCIYFKLGTETSDPDLALIALFFHDLRTLKKQRTKSLEQFINAFKKKALKIFEHFAKKDYHEYVIYDVLQELEKKNLPPLEITGKVIGHFQTHFIGCLLYTSPSPRD